MLKKILAVMLATTLVTSTAGVTFAAEKENEYDEEYAEYFNEVYQEYKDDKQFQMMVDDYGEEYGEKFIHNIVDDEINKIVTRGGGGNVCYQYVKNIKQTTDYNCGSTTVLQTLYGLDSVSNVSGTTDSQRIATLDNKYNVAAQGSMMVYQVADALNLYNKGNQTYTYKCGTDMTIGNFKDNIADSLTACQPVVLHAKTKYLTYYDGKNSGHYLSLDYYNRTTQKVRIVDCNYNAKYYGVHDVPVAEAYDAISKESGRYLIY